MKCERCEDLLSEQNPGREYDADCFGRLCPIHEKEFIANQKEPKP